MSTFYFYVNLHKASFQKTFKKSVSEILGHEIFLEKIFLRFIKLSNNIFFIIFVKKLLWYLNSLHVCFVHKIPTNIKTISKKSADNFNIKLLSYIRVIILWLHQPIWISPNINHCNINDIPTTLIKIRWSTNFNDVQSEIPHHEWNGHSFPIMQNEIFKFLNQLYSNQMIILANHLLPEAYVTSHHF